MGRWLCKRLSDIWEALGTVVPPSPIHTAYMRKRAVSLASATLRGHRTPHSPTCLSILPQGNGIQHTSGQTRRFGAQPRQRTNHKPARHRTEYYRSHLTRALKVRCSSFPSRHDPIPVHPPRHRGYARHVFWGTQIMEVADTRWIRRLRPKPCFCWVTGNLLSAVSSNATPIFENL